jgi:hypothetical protein
MPKVIPLEFEKTTVPLEASCVPADSAAPPAAPPTMEAVMVDPLRPKLTPLLFEKKNCPATGEVTPPATNWTAGFWCQLLTLLTAL